MRVIIKNNICYIYKEEGDPKFRRPSNGSWSQTAESTFLFHVKRILNEGPYDMVKVHVSRDGHLMGDEFQQIIRPRKPKTKQLGIEPRYNIAIYSHRYAIEDAGEAFTNAAVGGHVELAVAKDYWIMFGKHGESVGRIGEVVPTDGFAIKFDSAMENNA